jgi:hypothetical protein
VPIPVSSGSAPLAGPVSAMATVLVPETARDIAIRIDIIVLLIFFFIFTSIISKFYHKKTPTNESAGVCKKISMLLSRLLF